MDKQARLHLLGLESKEDKIYKLSMEKLAAVPIGFPTAIANAERTVWKKVVTPKEGEFLRQVRMRYPGLTGLLKKQRSSKVNEFLKT